MSQSLTQGNKGGATLDVRALNVATLTEIATRVAEFVGKVDEHNAAFVERHGGTVAPGAAFPFAPVTLDFVEGVRSLLSTSGTSDGDESEQTRAAS